MNYLTPAEVAERLRVDRRSVYRWLTEGQLRGARAGGVWRIAESDLSSFVVPTAAPKAPVYGLTEFDFDAVHMFSRWAVSVADAAARVAGVSDLDLLPHVERVHTAAKELYAALQGFHFAHGDPARQAPG